MHGQYRMYPLGSTFKLRITVDVDNSRIETRTPHTHAIFGRMTLFRSLIKQWLIQHFWMWQKPTDAVWWSNVCLHVTGSWRITQPRISFIRVGKLERLLHLGDDITNLRSLVGSDVSFPLLGDAELVGKAAASVPLRTPSQRNWIVAQHGWFSVQCCCCLIGLDCNSFA